MSRTGYPDIQDILDRKAEARKEISARSFGQKIAMLEAMRERLEPLRQARLAKDHDGSGEEARSEQTG